MRMAERAMARARGAAAWPDRAAAPPRPTRRPIREARTAGQGAHRARSADDLRGASRTLSFAMKLDLLLFGSIRSGPFFALLVKTADSRRRFARLTLLHASA